ncbi:MAG: hypothetical protein K8F26_13260 [Thiobacillus sp.]|nr:hypothetical protein [Thiobacillus sp.]
MNTLNIHAIAFAVSLTFSAGAMAQNVSKDNYLSVKDKIAADYKLAKASCDSLSGNPNDICMAGAKGNEKVALAELEASYKPTPENRHQARVVRADAEYELAKERCDDRAGNTKDVCMKEAKSVETAAKADARAQMKTADANATANEKSADARKDAAEDKLGAQYKVAKEKCDTYAGNAKAVCVNEAKVKFGQ